MKITIEDLYGLAEGITELSNKELPTKSAFVVSRNLKKIKEEIQSAEEIRSKLLERFSVDGEIEKGREKEFNAEFSELLEQEIDINLSTISLDDIGDTATAKMLLSLDKIIKEDE